MLQFIPPTIAQFQAQFPRDFKYGPGTDVVNPNDIQAAINEGQGLFNASLFENNVATFSATIIGTTTLGSPIITEISSVTGLAPGQPVTGEGIPTLTTILSISATSIMLSANATATAEDVMLTVGSLAGYSVSEAQIAFCYLTAHLLVLSLQNAGGLGAPESFQGPASSGGGTVQTKQVGSVSIGYQLPDFVMSSPTLSQYMRTGYGQKYVQMLAPKIPGRRVMVVGGEPAPFYPTPGIGSPLL
jgi:hypothetical protein